MMNKNLYTQILDHAKSFFAEISKNLIPGSYTAKDLDKIVMYGSMFNKTIYRNSIIDDKRYKEVRYNSSINMYEYIIQSAGYNYEISFETFRASFDACRVFEFLDKFRKLSGEKEYTFVKEDDTLKDCDYTFVINVDKTNKNIVKCIEKDELHPVFQYVYYDLKNQNLAATNAHKLQVFPAKAESLQRYTDKNMLEGVLLDPAMFKKPGQITVCVNLDRNIATCVKDGITYNIKQDYKFPYYKCVFTTLRSDMYHDFTPSEIKTIKTICKNYKSGNNEIVFEAAEDSNELSIKVYNYGELIKNQIIYTDMKFKFNLFICLSPLFLLDMLSDSFAGRIWYTDPTRVLAFDYNNGGYGVLMPRILQGVDLPQIGNSNRNIINFFDRTNIIVHKPIDLNNVEIVAPAIEVQDDTVAVAPVIEVQDDTVAVAPVIEVQDDTVAVAPAIEVQDDTVEVAPAIEVQDDTVAVAPVIESQDDTVAVAPVIESQDDTVAVAPVIESQDDTVAVAPVIEVQDDTVTVAPVIESQDDIVAVAPAIEVQDDTVEVAPVIEVQDDTVAVAPVNEVQDDITINYVYVSSSDNNTYTYSIDTTCTPDPVVIGTPHTGVTCTPVPAVSGAPRTRITCTSVPAVSGTPHTRITCTLVPAVSGAPRTRITCTSVPAISGAPRTRITCTSVPAISGAPRTRITCTSVPAISGAPRTRITCTSVPAISGAPRTRITCTSVPAISGTPHTRITCTPAPAISGTPHTRVTCTPAPAVSGIPTYPPHATHLRGPPYIRAYGISGKSLIFSLYTHNVRAYGVCGKSLILDCTLFIYEPMGHLGNH